MICSQCRFENPASMKFCVDCGATLQIACSSCQALMLPSYKFCGECGARLGTGPAVDSVGSVTRVVATEAVGNKSTVESLTKATEGERKQVTVVYCRLPVGFGAERSADRLHDELSSFFELAQGQMENLGGVINRFLSEGFMALFGAPVAYEDHPNRAVLASFRLLEALKKEGPFGGQTPVSLGIDTGSVVVGGAGAMAVGEATRLAAALQGLAAPGQVLVSGATARQARQAAILTLVEGTMVDGHEVEAWSALPRSEAMVSPFSSGTETPFIGRRRELRVLEELRDQVAAGHGHVVALSGDAGAGKSRLLHELYRLTYNRQNRVSYLRGQCASYAVGIPYLPIVGMIRSASGITTEDSSAEVRRKLESSLRAVGTDLEETLPFLLRLLGVQEGTEALDDMEPQAIQARTFAAMRRMVLDAAQHGLLVMEIEDLQWIDATSADFIDSLIEVMAAGRLLLLLTYRSGYQPRWLGKTYATQMRIAPLSEEDSKQLVAELMQRAGKTEDLAAEILAKAEGNPFFLEEMARTLIENADEDGGPDTVPDTVQGILMARIDRLPEEHRRLLRSVSVLGRELAMELIHEVWDGDGRPETLLEDLQRWELLYKVPSEDQSIFFFRQALTQEVTYQSLVASRRKELHLRVAQALERMYEGRLEEAYDRLIYHYPRAGRPETTVHYLSLFAHQAAASYSHSEAAQALRQALEQTEHLDPKDRDRRAIEVVLQLAESLLPLAQFPETLELCSAHLDRLERLQAPELAGPFYFWLAHTYTYLGLQDETREFADKAIEAAKSCADEVAEGKARYVLGRDGFWSGNFHDGIENSLRAVVLLERNDEPWWQGQAYWVAGFNHYVLGQFQQAIEALERALNLGEALDDYRLDTSWSLGYFYASLGEPEMGIEQCRRGLERSKDPLNSGVSTGFLGHAMLQKGEDLEAAEDCLQRASELMGQAGMQQLEGWFSAFLGEARLASGDLEGAEKAVARGLEACREARFTYGVGLNQSAEGRIALAAGRWQAAREALGAARLCFESLNVPLETARVDLDLGRLEQRAGDAQQARAALERSKAEFDVLGVPFWIAQVDEAVASLT